MNEYRQNAINHLKTHLGCVGYRDYLVTELEKLEEIEQILKDIPYGGDATVRRIQKVLEKE